MVGELEPPESPEFQSWLNRAERAVHLVNSYLLLHQIALPLGAKRPDIRLEQGKLAPFSLERIGEELGHRMAQHCVCDRVDFYDLYQMASVAWKMPLGAVQDFAERIRPGLDAGRAAFLFQECDPGGNAGARE